jgi:hypothetical protein
MIHWFLHITGVDNASGYWYAWWSGIVGDLSILSIPVVLLRKHQCVVRGCPRLGRHETGGGHLVCARHAPDGAPSAEDVRIAHEGNA